MSSPGELEAENARLSARVRELEGQVDELDRLVPRLRQLVERSMDMMYLHDGVGRFIDCNHHAYEALGYTREELLSRTVSDIEVDIGARPSEELGKLWAAMPVNVPAAAFSRRRPAPTEPVKLMKSNEPAAIRSSVV